MAIAVTFLSFFSVHVYCILSHHQLLSPHSEIQYLTLLSLHTITVLPLTTVYIVSEVHCTLNVQYLTLLSLHTITVLSLTTVYIVSEVHCTSSVLHRITMITVQISTIVLLRSTVDYHFIEV